MSRRDSRSVSGRQFVGAIRLKISKQSEAHARGRQWKAGAPLIELNWAAMRPEYTRM